MIAADVLRSRRNGWVLLGVVCLLLAMRLLWVAAGTTTGWQTIAFSWHDVTLGQIGWSRQRVPLELEPEEQVRFWEDQIQYVLQRHPDDAARHIAAAWLLDRPLYSLQGDVVDLPGFFDRGYWHQSDSQRLQNYIDRFHTRASPACLDLARRATELSPQTPDYWRMRALMLFGTFSQDARSPDCLAVLEQAIGHDPDNALYDYLGAVHLWQTSARQDYDRYPRVHIVVEDQERFARGLEWFQRGQTKSRLAASQGPAMLEFLAETSLGHVDAAQVAAVKMESFAPWFNIRTLLRWLEPIARERADAGDPAAALALLEQALYVRDQIEPSEMAGGTWRWMDLLQHSLLSQMQELAAEHDGLLPPERTAELAEEELQGWIGRRLELEALKRAAAEVPARSIFDYQLPALVMLYAQGLLAAMAVLSLLAWDAARVLPGRDRVTCRLGWVRQAALWTACFAGTFLLLGAMPAEIIDPDRQRIVIVVAGWLLGLVLLVLLARAMVRVCRRLGQDSSARPAWSLLWVLTLWPAVVATLLLLAGSVLPVRWTLRLFDLPAEVLLFGILAPLLLGALAVDYVRRQRRLGRRIGGRLGRADVAAGLLLALMTGLAAGCALLQPQRLVGFPLLPALSWNAPYPTYWQQQMAVDAGSWRWALAQWTIYRGHLWAPLLIVALAAAWCWRRTPPAPDGGSPEPRRWRERGRRALIGGGHSALALAIAATLIYLAVAPVAIRRIEDTHQAWLGQVSREGEHWQAIRRAEAEIAADPAAMEQLRKEVLREREEWAGRW